MTAHQRELPYIPIPKLKRHFDIFFADKMYETGKFAASVLESSYIVVSEQLNYRIQKRIPVFIYNSPNEFQQTNIVSAYLPEGVGGFTDVFKNRIAIPFNKSGSRNLFILYCFFLLVDFRICKCCNKIKPRIIPGQLFKVIFSILFYFPPEPFPSFPDEFVPAKIMS